MNRRDDSWKCACGVTVEYEKDPLGHRGETVVELDGVVHSCDTEDDDDF